jgi:hypothetical protein
MGKIREAGSPELQSERQFKALEKGGCRLAKVGVEGSNPFARSNFSFDINGICPMHEKRIRQLPAKPNALAQRSTYRVPFVRCCPIATDFGGPAKCH